jgi:hypothetical protein
VFKLSQYQKPQPCVLSKTMLKTMPKVKIPSRRNVQRYANNLSVSKETKKDIMKILNLSE